MKSAIQPRFLVLTSLILLLVSLPAAILAAAPGGATSNNAYLPFITKPGGPGGTGTLENGGSVEGPDGVGIGALTDTLTAPIQVSIAVTTAPTTTMPVPAQVLGDYYHITAGEDIYVAPERPFILAFPIPDGANTANLALAVLVSAEWLTDIEDRGDVWIFLEGMVDPDDGLFLTTLAGLTQAGNTFTLVEHPDFESPPNNASRAASQAGESRSPQFDLFTVHCVGFVDPAHCTEDMERFAAEYLVVIYDRIHQELGFNEPRLRYMDDTLGYNPFVFSTLGYSTYIEPKNSYPCLGDIGYYDIGMGALVLCLDPLTGFTTDSAEGLEHEFFHATQAGYLEAFADVFDRSRDRWVWEGMATSAGGSIFLDEMVRSEFYPDLREADAPFKSTLGIQEYLTQDFWVYYGQRGGLDLSYLITVLEEGSSSQAVVDALDSSGEILSVYWLWVKNHLMEPEIDYDGLLGTPCQLESNVVGTLAHMNVGGYSDPFADFLVDPLDTVVVELHFDWDGYTQADGWVIPVPGPNPDPIATQALQYKFYKEGESDCQNVPDMWRTFYDPDPSEQYFLVISNTDHDDSHNYRVMFEIGPSPP